MIAIVMMYLRMILLLIKLFAREMVCVRPSAIKYRPHVYICQDVFCCLYACHVIILCSIYLHIYNKSLDIDSGRH